MKKFFSFIAAFFFLFGIGYAQVTAFPYSEGFETNGTDLPAGWTHEIITGTSSWAVSPDEAHGGTYKAVFPWVNNQSARLITGAFNLTEVSNPALKFWYRLSPDYMASGNNDIVRVYYRTSADGQWTLLQEFVSDNTGYSPVWFEGNVSLPSPSDNYFLAFEANAKNIGEIMLDDIEIAEGSAPPPPPAVTVTDDTPWFVDFEGNGTSFPANWMQEVVNGTGVNWKVNQYGTPRGEYKAAITSFSSGPVVKLVTPALNISQVSNPRLKFWYNMQPFNNESDQMTVYYKTSAIGNWTVLKEYKTPLADWDESESIPLPNPSDEYYIAFEGIILGKNGVQIDDITVSTAPAEPVVITVTDANPYTEGFEDNGTAFADGWTQEQIAGTSTWTVSEYLMHNGTYKAGVEFIAGNIAKLITPTLNLTGVTEPQLKFWHYLAPPAVYDINKQDTLKVYYKTAFADEWTLLNEYINTVGGMGASWWEEAQITLPSTSADCYIAFEAVSHVSRIVIDDIEIAGSVTPVPVIAGESTLEFPQLYNDVPTSACNQTYTIRNNGTGVLKVDSVVRETSSPSISITGLPVTINPSASANVTVTLDAAQLASGLFEGNFLLASNDPVTPQFNVDVTAQVATIGVSPYIEETFNEEFPVNWLLQYFSRITWSGINNTSCMRSFLHHNQQSGWIQTGRIDMGTNPVVSFHYKAFKDLSGNETVAGDGAVKYQVLISDDSGETWNTLKDATFDEHIASADYQYVEIDAASYAGKVCLVKFHFQPNLEQLASNEQINLYFDNINAGTELVNELGAIAISGNQLPFPNETYQYRVSVKNSGTAEQTADTYQVKLMMNGETGTSEISALQGVSIQKYETKEFVFDWTPDTSGIVYLYGEIVMNSDQYTPNNITDSLRVDVRPSTVETVTIGNGTERYKIPYNLSYSTSVSQSLYYPHELGVNGGEIRSLVYTADIQHTGTAYSNVGIQVWIGETDKADLHDGWVDPSTLTEVYNGIITFPAGQYEVAVPFNHPYKYKGGNLVVYSFRKNNSHNGGDYTTDHFIGTSYPNSQRSIAYASFSTTIDPKSPPAFNEGINGIPNTQFAIDTKEMGTLHGTVTDGANPMQDVDVTIVGTQYTIKTDAEGKYQFPKLTSGELSVEFSKFGYHIETADVTIATDNETVKDITMTAIPKVTVSGTVTAYNAPDGIEGVIVSLTGYENYIDTTDVNGAYEIPDVYTGFSYAIHAKFTGYYNYDSDIDVELNNVTSDFELEGKEFPAVNIFAEVANDKTTVTWDAPAGFISKNYTYDDGTYEQGVRGFVAYPRWYGTRFDVSDAGEIVSFDIYGAGDNEVTNSLSVTVEIFDASKIFVGSSEPFILPSYGWVNVPVNNIPFTGTFYAMVRWQSSGGTNFLGVDTNGPNAKLGTDWTYNGAETSWIPLAEAMPTTGAGALMIRANINADQGTIAKTVIDANNYLQRAPIPANAVSEVSAEHPYSIKLQHPVDANSTYNAHSIKAAPAPMPVGYNVYRLIKGQDENEWQMLDAIDATTTLYIDAVWSELTDGAYRYAVKAKYPDDKLSRAVISNIVGKNMEVEYTVNVETNSGDDPTGATVTLVNQNDALYTYTLNVETNNAVFPKIWKGVYTVTVAKDGFNTYIENDITIDDNNLSHLVNITETVHTPFNLTVDVTDADAMLRWNNPSSNFTDDMEQYESFIINSIGNYILHDLDGQLTYPLQSQTTDYVFPNEGSAHAFMVFNPTQTSPPIQDPSIAAHSGSAFLASFAEQTPGNDWLVLPKHWLVKGSMLKFYAKSLTSQYGLEAFKVAVSTTDTNPESFTVISEGEHVNAPVSWTEFAFDLSAYAEQNVHVAIICVSNGFVFMLDDIFLGVPEKAEGSKSFSGYIIYLNNEEVASGVMDTEHKFTSLANGEYTAGVKTVYTSGESTMQTVPFTISVSNISNNSLAGVAVYGNGSSVYIVNKGNIHLQSVQITDIAGRIVYSGKANTSTVIPVNASSGIYVVKLVSEDNSVSSTKVRLTR